MTRGTLTVRVRGVPFPIEFADWTHDRLYHTVEFQGGDTGEIQAFIGAQGSPIPGGVRPLTEVDTNIPRSGDTGLQEGWEILVYSIQLNITREMARTAGGAAAQGFQLQDTVGNQVSRPAHVGGYDPAIANGGVLFDFMRKTAVRFTVNQKTQSEGPVEEYPSGSGIHVVTNGTDVEVAQNGPPSPRDQSAFVLPIWIRPNIAYVAKMRPQVGLGISGAGAASPYGVGGYWNWSAFAQEGAGADNLAALGFDLRVTLEGLLKRPVV